MRSAALTLVASPSRVEQVSSARTWRPATTRHRVSGVDSSRPTGPQMAAQNSAETMIASGDMPALWPYTFGSTMCATTTSDHQEQGQAGQRQLPAGIDGGDEQGIMAAAAIITPR